ncbi:MAG: helix-turn-helix transcriptional regulator [Clostridia bacterium]
MNNIGKKLKALRSEKNITQSQLAELLKVNRSLIAQYENNITTPSCENVIKLAVFYNVTTDYLFGLTNELGAKTKEAEKQELEYKLFVFNKK